MIEPQTCIHPMERAAGIDRVQNRNTVGIISTRSVRSKKPAYVLTQPISHCCSYLSGQGNTQARLSLMNMKDEKVGYNKMSGHTHMLVYLHRPSNPYTSISSAM